MHSSVLEFFANTTQLSDIQGKTILEVGSYNVNGSVKDLIIPAMAPSSYIGTDIRVGPYVDQQISAGELIRKFGSASFDVVLSFETLEHVEDWRAAIINMKSVLKPGGLFLLTTRSVGFPLHSHPDDYWRFSMDDMLEIFSDFDEKWVYDDPECPGVFVRAIKSDGWTYTDLSRMAVHSMK